MAVLEKNQQYAQILMADLASTASEMTTVHQYLYQSWSMFLTGPAVKFSVFPSDSYKFPLAPMTHAS